MGGICGKIGFKHLPFEISHLESLLRTFPKPGNSSIQHASSDLAIMGTNSSPGYLSGAKRKVLTHHSLLLAFFGTVYTPQINGLTNEDNQDIFELIINGLEKHGMPFLNQVEGDFVLAFWDGREQALYLAVDRTRIHSLYYQALPTGLAFSSYLPALLQPPFPTPNTINPRAIMGMVTISIIPTPESIFSEIGKIPPGHFLTYKNGTALTTPYWDLQFVPPHSSSSLTLQNQTRDLLTQAVASRLELENPTRQVGAFLSGGIDSSTILGTMASLSPSPIKCFSIGFDVEGFNELAYARIAAQAYGAEHFEYSVSPEDVYSALPFLIHNFDEPFGNASAIPTYFCAKLAKEHGIDILLAGDGGDELFAGNERYATQRIFDYYHLLPKSVRENLIEGLFFSAFQNTKIDLFRKIIKYVRRANIPYPDRLLSWGIKAYTDQHEFWEPSFVDQAGTTFSILDYFRAHYEHSPDSSELDRQLYIDMKLTLSDNDIPKVVNMTKAANLAVRFPFLDYHLMDFAAKIPANEKMKWLQLRTFFKKAYRNFLPNAVLKKSKHGFGLPVTVWLRENKKLNDLMNDVLLGKRFSQRGFITSKGLGMVLEAHKKDNTSLYGTIIWNLLILEMWLEHHDL